MKDQCEHFFILLFLWEKSLSRKLEWKIKWGLSKNMDVGDIKIYAYYKITRASWFNKIKMSDDKKITLTSPHDILFWLYLVNPNYRDLRLGRWWLLHKHTWHISSSNLLQFTICIHLSYHLIYNCNSQNAYTLSISVHLS